MNQSPSDRELAGKIIPYLDYGADHLDPLTGERLLNARKAVLSHYREKSVPAWGWAWAGQVMARVIEQHRTRYLIAGAALIAALTGVAYWQNTPGPVNEIVETDAGLLTDDLPINAYLDKGFDSWLKRSPR